MIPSRAEWLEVLGADEDENDDDDADANVSAETAKEAKGPGAAMGETLAGAAQDTDEKADDVKRGDVEDAERGDVDERREGTCSCLRFLWFFFEVDAGRSERLSQGHGLGSWQT